MKLFLLLLAFCATVAFSAPQTETSKHDAASDEIRIDDTTREEVQLDNAPSENILPDDAPISSDATLREKIEREDVKQKSADDDAASDEIRIGDTAREEVQLDNAPSENILPHDAPITSDATPREKIEREDVKEKSAHGVVSLSMVMGKTNWGHWSKRIVCRHGVTGFRLRVAGRGGWLHDDTGLNGIQLHCSDSVTREIPGLWGKWKNWQLCGGGSEVTSFTLRSEGRQHSGDDTAANNVRMKCDNGKMLDGGGTSWGSWEPYMKCPDQSYLCGVRAKIAKNQGIIGDDTGMNQIDFLCCVVVLSRSIIMGKTNWGHWSERIVCKHGVTGFRLRVESRGRRMHDDTGLNGIQLHCSHSHTREIPGIRGKWKKWQLCGGGSQVTSFTLRSQGKERAKDNTAANNVRMKCGNGKMLHGGGTSWGSWESYKRCPASTYLCGVRARIERKQGRGDDTGMNQIKFLCCTVLGS